MTIQSTSSDLHGAELTPELSGVTAPPNFPDVASIARLANEFFSAWPNQSDTSTHGLNFDVSPDLAHPPHVAQPAEPLVALGQRAPNIGFEKSLNPDFPEHIPNYPDHPERRAMASAPVIGGANLPKPPFEPQFPQFRDQVGPIMTSDLKQGHSEAVSPFYFINEFKSPAASEAEIIAQPSVAAESSTWTEQQQAASQQHSLPSHQSNTASAQTEPYYFLDLPELNLKPQANQQQYQPPQTQFISTSTQALDVQQIRRDFPILQQQINGQSLVWLDNAATTQKPQQVIDRIGYFYQNENSNIHRAAHTMAARATDAYEHARQVVAEFIGAESSQEIIFVRGATEGINLIAKTWGVQNIAAGDEIIVSHLEHHANIVPWYQLCQQTGAKLKVIPVDDTGQIMLQSLPNLITPRTKLISITQVSNALGTVTPVAEVIQIAHGKNVRVLVDGAQSVSHMSTDVRGLDADFFVFSGHKVFGPTGIGAVYAKPELLESMPVWEGGGCSRFRRSIGIHSSDWYAEYCAL
ncbi:L-selenocysteine selenide-lyase (L-alanine-forming) [Acinetobacter calcoaceticus]|uniref:cysteine desulfurase n=1 Tax=Acinetobacter calcoaceticus TaxID=471 RepID=A0A4R1XNK9_ACICA|nr:L-selenocysteine selenide-lyase (L-alanine-forming) [Acinetobacter calcoaceticus]